MFHGGFVNQYPHPHPQSLSLAKNWKPYKLELKGSKLYFYKPPGDRSARVKELFLTGFDDDADADPEAQLVVNGGEGEGSGRAQGRQGVREEGRKNRAYWGRGTHPELVRDDEGAVERGTFEALVHEAVFGTVTAVDEYDDDTERKYEPYAPAILLSVPFLVGKHKFETELKRCCTYLVASDGVQRTHATECGGW